MDSVGKRLVWVIVTAMALIASIVGAASGAPASVSAVASPAAPSSLTVSFGSNGMVLAWTDNSADEVGTSIERCLGPGCTAFGQIATVAAGTTTYRDGFYDSGVSRYRVRAFNSGGFSAYSNTVEMQLLSTGDVLAHISAAPTTGQAPLTVTLDGSASVAVNGTITGWSWSFGDDQTGSGPAVSHTYATPGVYAASLAVTTGGVFPGRDSTAVIITVTAPPLVAPNDLAATSPVRGQIRLTWTNPVSAATSLALERCKGAGCTSFARIAALTTSTTSYTDAGVKRGSTYSYRLAASDATTSAYSNTAVATVRR